MPKRKLPVKEVEEDVDETEEVFTEPAKCSVPVDIPDKAITWIVEPDIDGPILGQNQIFLRPVSTKILSKKIDKIEDSFFLFFTPDIVSKILENTNNCGRQLNEKTFNEINVDLMHAYFGLLIFTGIYR